MFYSKYIVSFSAPFKAPHSSRLLIQLPSTVTCLLEFVHPRTTTHSTAIDENRRHVVFSAPEWDTSVAVSCICWQSCLCRAKKRNGCIWKEVTKDFQSTLTYLQTNLRREFGNIAENKSYRILVAYNLSCLCIIIFQENINIFNLSKILPEILYTVKFISKVWYWKQKTLYPNCFTTLLLYMQVTQCV